MVQVLGQPHIVGFHTTLNVIDTSGVLLKSNHGIVDLVIVDLLAYCQSTAGCLVSSQQRFLPRLRIAKLGFETRDILIQFRQALIDGQVVLLQNIDTGRHP